MAEERLRFVARLLDGEKMAAVCAEFGISRKTGYKTFDRHKDGGLQGLTDRSRRPYRHANRLPAALEDWIVRLKREYRAWGAPKIRERLPRRCPDVQCPAISTVHAVLSGGCAWAFKSNAGLPALAYPWHDWTAVVTHCGPVSQE